MTTNFNRIGHPGAMITGALLLFWVGLSGAADFQAPFLRLPSGVTGEEIQQALEALPAAGGEVILPPEVIVIRQPLRMHRDSQTLSGAGTRTVLRLADKADCPVLLLGEPVNTPQRIVKNLCVRDLGIDGNRSQQTRELWKQRGEGSEIRNNGITVQGVSDSLITNVTAARCRSGGLVTTRGVRRLVVSHLEAFDNEFDGLACYQTEDSLFTDLNLHDNPGAGISLDLAFNHNVISNAVLTANDLGVFMRSSRNNQFFNIAIHGSHHFGIFMAHAETPTALGWGPAPKTACTHNSFTNLVAVDCGGPAFRINDVTCTNNVLIRALFDQNPGGGLSLAQQDLVMLQ